MAKRPKIDRRAPLTNTFHRIPKNSQDLRIFRSGSQACCLWRAPDHGRNLQQLVTSCHITDNPPLNDDIGTASNLERTLAWQAPRTARETWTVNKVEQSSMKYSNVKTQSPITPEIQAIPSPSAFWTQAAAALQTESCEELTFDMLSKNEPVKFWSLKLPIFNCRCFEIMIQVVANSAVSDPRGFLVFCFSQQRKLMGSSALHRKHGKRTTFGWATGPQSLDIVSCQLNENLAQLSSRFVCVSFLRRRNHEHSS